MYRNLKIGSFFHPPPSPAASLVGGIKIIPFAIQNPPQAPPRRGSFLRKLVCASDSPPGRGLGWVYICKKVMPYKISRWRGLGMEKSLKRTFPIILSLQLLLLLLFSCKPAPQSSSSQSQSTPSSLTLNQQAEGYLGIWYMNQPLDNEYKFKYSGGLGTYCAKHKPFAVYSKEAQKTFFCFGGVKKGYLDKFDLAQSGGDNKDLEGALYHMISYYDHRTGEVPRPTILLDKRTRDAHDNPVISLDDKGYIWIFSTSHGTNRPSYVHKSREPFDISTFDLIEPVYLEKGEKKVLDNFSYMQVWHVDNQGFVAFFTKYNQPAKRTNYFLSSEDGVNWNELTCLSAIDEGHYQISAANAQIAGTAFNYHPNGQGLNWRTNLYYMQTQDLGKSWQAADGTNLNIPLTEPQNSVLIHDYESEGIKVYLKDIRYDAENRPVILYITSHGYKSGPESGPRTWKTARWTGKNWERKPITTSDNNYDMGSLWINEAGEWMVVGPTETGPQPFNPGGELAAWKSTDQGNSWTKMADLTQSSEYNHTYVRRPVASHPDFWALWADGHGRQPSDSRLYFCNEKGEVFKLPEKMKAAFAKPEKYLGVDEH